MVTAAAISRFASLLDGLESGWLGDPAFDAIVERDLAEGKHENPTDRPEWFTTAFFHDPDGLRAEVEDAGLELEALLGIEGPGWLLWELWDEPKGRENIMRVARAVEQEPSMGVSAHLLVAGQELSLTRGSTRHIRTLAHRRGDAARNRVRYQLWHALALFAVVLVRSLRFPIGGGWFAYLTPAPFQLWPAVAGWLFIAVVVLFCGSLYALALIGDARWGVVTPSGVRGCSSAGSRC